MEDLRPDLLGEGEIQTDTRADFAKLIGVAHSTILFFSVGIGLSAAFALKTIEETRKLVNVIPYLSWQINIFAAFSIPFSTPLETIRAVKNINRIE